MASIVIDHLYSVYGNSEHKGDVGIAYVYCDFKRSGTQDPGTLHGSILKQLSHQKASLPECVVRLYNKLKSYRPLIPEETLDTLRTVAESYQQVFLIIDALDEFQTGTGLRSKFLSQLFSLQTTANVNIFATSRVIPEVEQEFIKQGSICLEISAKKDDVRAYLQENMSGLPHFVRCNPGLGNQVLEGIMDMVDGM